MSFVYRRQKKGYFVRLCKTKPYETQLGSVVRLKPLLYACGKVFLKKWFDGGDLRKLNGT